MIVRDSHRGSALSIRVVLVGLAVLVVGLAVAVGYLIGSQRKVDPAPAAEMEQPVERRSSATGRLALPSRNEEAARLPKGSIDDLARVATAGSTAKADRIEAMLALRGQDGKAARKLATPMLKDPEMFTEAAMFVLYDDDKPPDKESIDEVLSAFKGLSFADAEQKAPATSRVLEALKYGKDERFFDIVSGLLKAKEPLVRRVALANISAGVDPKYSFSILLDALGDPDTAQTALNGLRTLAARDFGMDRAAWQKWWDERGAADTSVRVPKPMLP